MKKVLVISYYWPPAGGPGSQRIVKFVKYMPQFGWHPVVLTVNDGEFPYTDNSLTTESYNNLVFRTSSIQPFSIYKRLTGRKSSDTLPVGLQTSESSKSSERVANWLRNNLFVPDARIGWVPFAIKKALSIIRTDNIDAIFTSSPPHSLQLIGLYLKKRTKLPWITDLRDPWTDIRYYQFAGRSKFATNLDGYYERKTLQSADQILTVSDDLVRLFKHKLRQPTPSKFNIIPNGYDEPDFSPTISVNKEKFTLLHSGNMLAHQNPQVLWQALRKMIDTDPKLVDIIKVRFFGRVHADAQQSISENKLDAVCEINSFIPHAEIVKEMQAAAMLLMVIPNVSNNLGIVTGKLFEYIGSGRPITVIGPENSDAAKILNPLSHSAIIDYNNTEKCLRHITTTYLQWRDGQLPESPAALREPYSRQHQTKRLTSIMDSVVE